jgi:cytochrome c
MIKLWPIYAAIFGAVIFGAAWYGLSGDRTGDANNTARMMIPELTPDQDRGRILFDANCAICHGPNAAGSDQGPPLVHRIYEPSHHGDIAFLLAARQGVRAHHWQFGNMPAIETVTDQDVVQITAYIRALQRANGIN